MSSFRGFVLVITALVVLLVVVPLGASASESSTRVRSKAATTYETYRPFLINNVFNYYGNNGFGSYLPNSVDNEGFEFPKGSGKHMIFMDGVVWGCHVRGDTTLLVGGSGYSSGLQPGRIVVEGTASSEAVADDPSLSSNRMFRVRPDVGPRISASNVSSQLAAELALINRYESYTAADLYKQYCDDWSEWPASNGAPFTDVDGDGSYNPSVDLPGIPGADQTLWYVANDLDSSLVTTFAGSKSIGLEMQRTIWGFKRTGGLGNAIFVSTLLINKSGRVIDSLFIGQFADPDLGDASDDYVGVDSARSLGYVYNSEVDATYGTAVPAGGFHFLQGPVVAGSSSDSAVWQFRRMTGRRNLPMTSCVPLFKSSSYDSDPATDSRGPSMWYNLLNGLESVTGAPFVDPVTGLATKICPSGDPVSDPEGLKGWVDGTHGGPRAADRRFVMASGPITMAPGDTQEVVLACLAGKGADRYSSITILRSVDDVVQEAYNHLFHVPKPPPAPDVVITGLDGKVVISWGDSAGAAKTETYADEGFTFEGYRVWEFADEEGDSRVLLGTYDRVDSVTTISDTVYDDSLEALVPVLVVKGHDNGIIHRMSIDTSKVRGSSLVNGTRYYFGVTAYGFNPNPTGLAPSHAIEDVSAPLSVVPATPGPGIRYSVTYGDTLRAVLSDSVLSGNVVPLVVDPSKLTGHRYKVFFIVDSTTSHVTWGIRDSTLDKVVLSNQTNQSGDEEYLIVDGVMVKVIEGSTGMRTHDLVDQPNDSTTWGWNVVGSLHWSRSGANQSGYPLEGFLQGYSSHGAMGFGPPFFGQYLGWGSPLTNLDEKNIVLKLAATDADGNLLNASDSLASYAYRWVGNAQNAAAQSAFASYITNSSRSYAYQDYQRVLPIAAYNSETTPWTRLAVGFLENNVEAGLVDGKYWPPMAGTDNSDSASAREWLFVMNTPYTGSKPDARFQVNLRDNMATIPVLWLSLADRASSSLSAFSAGDEFLIFMNHGWTNSSSASFTAIAPTYSTATAVVDVSRINVFPNPYVGFNPQETSRSEKFVTFNHLPRRAVVRIFTLAGVLVRTLQKESDSQFLTWNLRNEASSQVAAGVYIVHIDMPDLGSTRFLKLAVIPEK